MTSGQGPMQQPATWNAVAQGYAEEIVPHYVAFAREALSMVQLDGSARVLDVAAGPGTLAFAAAPHVGQVDAVDFAPGMIDELAARAAREGVANIQAKVMDAQSLAFPDETFDAAFCLLGVMFFPDRALALREMHRVLKRGGHAVIATWSSIERRPMMRVGFEALAEALPELPAPPKGDLQHPEECAREMMAAGFREVTTRTFTALMHISSAEHYMQVMTRAGAPFSALKRRLGDQAWSAAVERMLAAIRNRVPPGGADLAAEAILTRGTRGE